MITKISAKKYYGKHSTGSVILWNNIVIYHASIKEINKFLKEIKNETTN